MNVGATDYLVFSNCSYTPEALVAKGEIIHAALRGGRGQERPGRGEELSIVNHLYHM